MQPIDLIGIFDNFNEVKVQMEYYNGCLHLTNYLAACAERQHLDIGFRLGEEY